MAETIIYGNAYGEEISQQEFSVLDDYSIIYKEDAAVKRIEYYRNKKVKMYEYYLGSDELVSSVVEKYKDYFLNIITRQFFDDYFIEEVLGYGDGTLKFRAKRLYDWFGDELCKQNCELTTGEPILKGTEKYLYADDEGDSTLNFDYDESGAVRSIWGELVQNTDQSRKGAIYGDRILFYFPNLFIEHPYYQNADLVPILAIKRPQPQASSQIKLPNKIIKFLASIIRRS